MTFWCVALFPEFPSSGPENSMLQHGPQINLFPEALPELLPVTGKLGFDRSSNGWKNK
jgi:hypothetical protein